MSDTRWRESPPIDSVRVAIQADAMVLPTGARGSEQVRASHRIMINSDPEVAWDIQSHVTEWPSWQTDISDALLLEVLAPGATFTWTSFDTTIDSVVLDLVDGHCLRFGEVLGDGGCFHEWTFEPVGRGVLVTATAIRVGETVTRDREGIQTFLDEGLIFWLDQLKAAAEARN